MGLVDRYAVHKFANSSEANITGEQREKLLHLLHHPFKARLLFHQIDVKATEEVDTPDLEHWGDVRSVAPEAQGGILKQIFDFLNAHWDFIAKIIEKLLGV